MDGEPTVELIDPSNEFDDARATISPDADREVDVDVEPIDAAPVARRSILTRLRGASIESWITFVVVAGAAFLVFWRLHPAKILSSSTPTGGDMGAHVWGPAYLRDELLPSLRIRGWSPDWYGGFPAMQFYMVLPYLMIVLLDVVLPYGTAFKLIAVSGVVTIPVTAWAMGRLARWPFPIPPLLAVAGLLFVFDFNFTIYGGNVASTLAGEFAFSIGLSFALLYLGLLMRSLDTGRGRARAAVVLALVALSHLIPLLFAVGATAIIVAMRGMHRLPSLIGRGSAAFVIGSGFLVTVGIWNVSGDPVPRIVVVSILVLGLLIAELRRSWWALTVGIVAMLLSAFWTVPFFLRREFLNDMGWEKLHEVRENLFFPTELGGDNARLDIRWLLGLAALAAIVGFVRWHRASMTWTAIAVVTALGFVHWPQHRLWNARLLPFWYLSLYVLAAFGVWWIATGLLATAQENKARITVWVGRIALDRKRVVSWATAPIVFVASVMLIGFYLGVAPGGAFDEGDYEWGPFTASQGDRNFVAGWANWNFTGYEGRPDYPEYFDLVTTMEQVGTEFGCGRALWEYDHDQIGAYGTPMAPMLLPHWTDGCIGSMEGLYFESSPTVPFHFLMQSELSANPSRPMRGLPYSELDVEQGATHLQMSGVRYYIAFSNEALSQATRQPERLEPIAFSDPWTVFLVRDSDLVEPLAYEPVVADNADNAGRAWTDPAVGWFNDPEQWEVPIAAEGPPEWARVAVLTDRVDEAGNPQVDAFEPGPRRQLRSVEVSDVDFGGDEISFRVDETGVPILVKISYFPNWSVDGAQGPYRVTPNWMVVVPTDNEVRLSYGSTSVEWLAWSMTILGIIAVWLMARRSRAGIELDAAVRLRGAPRPAPVDGEEADGGRDAVGALLGEPPPSQPAVDRS